MMLSVAVEDAEACQEIARWLETEAPLRRESFPNGRRGAVGSLKETTGADTLWGGSKFPECCVWAGALNNADLDAVTAHVAGTDWLVPDSVQLFLMDQDQTYFTVWMIRAGQIQQYTPQPPG